VGQEQVVIVPLSPGKTLVGVLLPSLQLLVLRQQIIRSQLEQEPTVVLRVDLPMVLKDLILYFPQLPLKAVASELGREVALEETAVLVVAVVTTAGQQVQERLVRDSTDRLVAVLVLVVAVAVLPVQVQLPLVVLELSHQLQVLLFQGQLEVQQEDPVLDLLILETVVQEQEPR
jgi:hypothetical protein